VLEALLTDYWHVPLPGLPGSVSSRLKRRWDPELANARVLHQNTRTLTRELGFRLRGTADWDRFVAANAAYQAAACKVLRRFPDAPDGTGRLLFSYSYAASEIFREAKHRGWKTLLGQIDPGPVESRLIEGIEQKWPDWVSTRGRVPGGYFERWRDELELADGILVNSDWTREALIEEGVDPAKLVVVPIPYEPAHAPTPRVHPAGFTAERPLRLLFLGQINLRKGAAELLETMARLQSEPVELTMVGTTHMTIPEPLRSLPSIKWYGQVPHQETERFFQEADWFVLPTHSDGFGLAQVEALAHGLPVLTTPFCARMVSDGIDGRVLPEVSVSALEHGIREVLQNPQRLTIWSANCRIPSACRMDEIAARMMELCEWMVGRGARPESVRD
jgi:glycosyltransferase involved in cell wall biosynthesis